jgi:hypothetical protein
MNAEKEACIAVKPEIRDPDVDGTRYAGWERNPLLRWP